MGRKEHPYRSMPVQAHLQDSGLNKKPEVILSEWQYRVRMLPLQQHDLLALVMDMDTSNKDIAILTDDLPIQYYPE
jgi:hypothetical protein